MECLTKRVFSPKKSDEWISTLVRIGAWIATNEASRPATIGICLPRIEFAGLLLASGVCLKAAQSPLPGDWHERLGELAGRRIAYSLRGRNPHVFWEGILCKPLPADLNIVRIQGTSNGDFVDWPAADLFSVQLDPEKNGLPLTNAFQSKKAFCDEHSSRLRTLLPEDAVGRLCSWWLQLTLVGVKNRLNEELNESLPCAGDNPAISTFTDLLRPEGRVADSFILRLLSAKDLTRESSCGIVIIEGSRRLSEHMKATQQNSRIVLLGRNEPHYSDCADVLISHFQQRRDDLPLLELERPNHIKLKTFYH